jgi:uncharacterized lipoprotein YehR (DUF1307 family)
MKQLILSIILVFMITSCQQNNRDQAVSDMAGHEGEIALITKESQVAQASASSIDIIETNEVNKKKIIKDGRLGIKVSELEKAKSRIDTLLKNPDIMPMKISTIPIMKLHIT